MFSLMLTSLCRTMVTSTTYSRIAIICGGSRGLTRLLTLHTRGNLATLYERDADTFKAAPLTSVTRLFSAPCASTDSAIPSTTRRSSSSPSREALARIHRFCARACSMRFPRHHQVRPCRHPFARSGTRSTSGRSRTANDHQRLPR